MKSIIEDKYQFTIQEEKLLQQIEDDVFFLKDTNYNSYKFKVHKVLSEHRKSELLQIYEWLVYLKGVGKK